MAFNLLEKILPPVLYAKLKKGGKKTAKPLQAKRGKALAASKLSLSKAKAGAKAGKAPAAPTAKFGPARLFLIAVAFALAGVGQWWWMQQGDNRTMLPGWIFFILGSGLFILVLWPWRKEEWKEEPISRPIEIVFLVLILGLAAFFRVFRLGELPPGIFFDQGFVGWAALKILHEGYHPFYTDEVFRNPPLLLYQMALWLAVFSVNQFNFYLFFALLSMVSLVFIYWTFRQLAGPRVALMGLFVLAVMRWHTTFSRNGFPTIQVPLYMFGTMAFLLHGLKTGKRWAFVTAGVFFALGLYTYQAYKIFPMLLVVFGLYELASNWGRLTQASKGDGFLSKTLFLLRHPNAKNLAAFSLVFFLLVTPLIYQTFKTHDVGWRESNYNIFQKIHEAHSLEPLWFMISNTAQMFNRTGDVNERHNIPNHRMLDNYSATLFVLGLAFAFFHLKQRKYFFGVAGLFIMSLACILSQDPAHANRMLGTVPFVALLAVLPIAALWRRVQAAWGILGELVIVLFLLQPAFLMGLENYKTFFEEFAGANSLYSSGVWAGYSVSETRVGELILKEGENYDYYLMPRYYDYPTVNFLSYFHKDRVKKMEMPGDFAPFKTDDPKRGVCYVMMHEHSGVLKLLKELYPTGILEEPRDLTGAVMVEFFKVPASAVAQAHGLKGDWGKGEQVVTAFPKGLPPGPYHGVYKGNVFVAEAGNYRFATQSNGKVSWSIAGRTILPATRLFLPRGFYSIEVRLNAGEGPVQLNLSLVGEKGSQTIDSGDLTPLSLDRGMLGHWYSSADPGGPIVLQQWNPLLNFPHGGDFTYTNYAFSVIWEGAIEAPESGDYGFESKTDEPSRLEIDGRQVFDWGANRVGTIHLLKGTHKIKVFYKKVLGPIFSLDWKTPSEPEFTDIPMDAFGETGPMALSGAKQPAVPTTLTQ